MAATTPPVPRSVSAAAVRGGSPRTGTGTTRSIGSAPRIPFPQRPAAGGNGVVRQDLTRSGLRRSGLRRSGLRRSGLRRVGIGPGGGGPGLVRGGRDRARRRRHVPTRRGQRIGTWSDQEGRLPGPRGHRSLRPGRRRRSRRIDGRGNRPRGFVGPGVALQLPAERLTTGELERHVVAQLLMGRRGARELVGAGIPGRRVVVQAGPRLGHTRERADRPGLEPTQAAGGHLEGHHRAHLDVTGPVGDGRAVEGDPMAGPVLDDAEAPRVVELGHVPHQRRAAHRHQSRRPAPDGRLGGHRSVDDLGQGQLDDVGGPPVLQGRDEHIDLRLGDDRLHREPSPAEELRDRRRAE